MAVGASSRRGVRRRDSSAAEFAPRHWGLIPGELRNNSKQLEELPVS